MKLHEIYAQQMTNHSQGHALYHPLLTSSIKPGACGYFNSLGNWNPIADLSDNEKLLAAGFRPVIEQLEEAQPGPTEEWGPRCSKTVKHSVIDLQAGASGTAAGFPAEANAFYEFSSTSNYGAILMTTPPIVHNSYLHEEPFRRWLKDNANIILNKRPEVKEHDIFVVTSTYSARKCALNASITQSRFVRIGFTAGTVPAGEIAPSGQWYQESADSGWKYYGKDAQKTTQKLRKKGKKERKDARNRKQDGSNQEDTHGQGNGALPENEERVVVFISGLQFSYQLGSNINLAVFREKNTNACLDALGSYLLIVLMIILSIASLGILPLCVFLRRRPNQMAAPYRTPLSEMSPAPSHHYDLAQRLPSSGTGPVRGGVKSGAAAAATGELEAGSTMNPGSALGSMPATSPPYYDAFSTQDQSGTNYIVSVSPAGTPAPSPENSETTYPTLIVGAKVLGLQPS